MARVPARGRHQSLWCIYNPLDFEPFQHSHQLPFDAPSSLAAYRQLPVQPRLTSVTYQRELKSFEGWNYGLKVPDSLSTRCWLVFNNFNLDYSTLDSGPSGMRRCWLGSEALEYRNYARPSGLKFNLAPVLDRFLNRSSPHTAVPSTIQPRDAESMVVWIQQAWVDTPRFGSLGTETMFDLYSDSISPRTCCFKVEQVQDKRTSDSTFLTTSTPISPEIIAG
ncbi:hypothetical protein C8R46DRAFT_1221756 [Mycena filopes]|nr:hypothetical protein C8R46DRAFT_1221756 [Mycena filopes]